MGEGKPDPRLWTFWGKQQELSISDAAYLICDQLPRGQPLVDDDPMVSHTAEQLYTHITRLLGTHTAGHYPRELFIEWCAEQDLAPAAWFQESRSADTLESEATGNPETELTDRETPAVLGMLAGVLEAKYGDGTVADLASERSRKIGRVTADIQRWTGLTDKTLE